MSRAEPTTVTDLNTLLAVLRHAAVGRTALRVTLADDETGEEVVTVRMETDRMSTPSPASGGRGSLAPVFGLAGRRGSDPRPVGGVTAYGIPEPEYDAPGPLKDLRGMRRTTNHMCRGYGEN